MSIKKIEQDWAYKQAKQIVTMFDEPALCPLSIKRIASMLRRAYRKGGEAQRINDNTKALQASMPKLTAATIRKCKAQLEAVSIPWSEYCSGKDFGAYSWDRCKHGFYAVQCEACERERTCSQ